MRSMIPTLAVLVFAIPYLAQSALAEGNGAPADRDPDRPAFIQVGSETTIPDFLTGGWDGWGVQESGGAWSIAVTVQGLAVEIVYPSLNCGGVLELLWADDETARFRESLSFGLENCVDGGEVVLTSVSENHVEYHWQLPGSGQAWGTLHRRRRGAYQ